MNDTPTSELIAVKSRFDLPQLTTIGGATIDNVAVGYETYGTLNAARDNAILVCHYFSGTSHAAGKYAASDAAPGYWDAIIGPGKAVDTNVYFVISVDSLVNLNAGDPRVITTGPATIDLATKAPYGPSFPAVTIGDFVRVQKALLDSLGIARLHAVMGPSMGGLQTWEWAATYPDMVGRIIPVIAAPNFGGWMTGWLSIWAQPIRLDPTWNGGNYYGGPKPVAGLLASLKLITLHALHSHWADQTAGRALSNGAGPLAALAPDAPPFAIDETLDIASAARAAFVDANHLLYLVRANQTFIPGAGAGATSVEEGLRKIKAPVLLLFAPQDQVFLAEWIRQAADMLRENGLDVETGEIDGPFGHYNGIVQIASVGPRIADFLARRF